MALLLLGMGTWCQVVVFEYVDPPATAQMLWSTAIGLMSGNGPSRAAYHWRPLDEISPFLHRAVMAGEDQRFLSHNGFDATEMVATLKGFVRSGRLRGASTITMQAARSLFIPSSRTVIRKIVEAWYTVLMEVCWSKRRILEIYLNTVDWGDNIIGAEAASQAYYGKRAGSLTQQEAALLAAVLPNPHRFSPVHPNRLMRTRQRKILKDMRRMPDV